MSLATSPIVGTICIQRTGDHLNTAEDRLAADDSTLELLLASLAQRESLHELPPIRFVTASRLSRSSWPAERPEVALRADVVRLLDELQQEFAELEVRLGS